MSGGVSSAGGEMIKPDQERPASGFGYDAAIAYVDHHVGIVLEELDRQGVLDDTTLIVSADHGDAFGEHGIYTDHVCADECIHRIPLIVRWPGMTRGGTHSRSLLTNVDFAPTLCELLGFAPARDWDGASFASQVRGEAGGPNREYLVWDHALYTVQRAVRTERHLMIRTHDSHGYCQFDPLELYDLEADPYQTTNLCASQPTVLARCEERLAAWEEEQKRKPGFREDPITAILRERGLSA